MHPALLLFRAWFQGPARGMAGIVGLLLLGWSIVPFARRPDPSKTRLGFVAETLDLLQGIGGTWRARPLRAVAGILGLALFLWSAVPIIGMW